MNSVQHRIAGSKRRRRRNVRFRAAGWLLLATGFEAVHAQSADLFFEGVLLVEPAPPAEVVVPVGAGNAMGGGQRGMGMGAAGNNAGAGGQGAAGGSGQGTAGGGGLDTAGGIGQGARGAGGQGGMGGGAASEVPAPVQFFMPAERRSEVAVVMIPGGGLPSWSYTTTPDGREGWAQQFARAGVPVYLMNPPAGFREELGRWNRETVWPLWGMGPEFGTPYPDGKHPVEAIDNLHASFYIARAPGGADHLRSLLDEIGPAVVLAHSAGGSAMFSAARALHPNLRGTIAVETTNCPTDEAALATIYVKGERAFLSLWGDNLDRGAPSMLTRYASCRQASETVAAAGGRAQTIHLPEDRGIVGNSHLMMQDRNNNEISDMILEWMGTELGAVD